MDFTIFRDLASIAFVRCHSPIPGTQYHAEGSAFSVANAVAKCRSEHAEGTFQLAHPLRRHMLGIAAHPESRAATENAWNETLETLVLEQVAVSGRFYGFSLTFLGIKMCLGKVADRFVAIALFAHRGAPTATQAVSKNPLKALLKAWTEFRNVQIYNPAPANLKQYTKANRLLTELKIANLQLIPKLRTNPVSKDRLKRVEQMNQTHHITYFIKETII